MIFVSLITVGTMYKPKAPEHAFFEEPALSCNPLRRIAHEVSVKSQLVWEESWFEPTEAEQEILQSLQEFHKNHTPALQPREDWPEVRITDFEKMKTFDGSEGSKYLVKWEANYEVSSCSQIEEGWRDHPAQGSSRALQAQFIKK